MHEPVFNVYLNQVAEWGIKAVQRSITGLTCTTAVPRLLRLRYLVVALNQTPLGRPGGDLSP